jgi:hypothetical protein
MWHEMHSAATGCRPDEIRAVVSEWHFWQAAEY